MWRVTIYDSIPAMSNLKAGWAWHAIELELDDDALLGVILPYLFDGYEIREIDDKIVAIHEATPEASTPARDRWWIRIARL